MTASVVKLDRGIHVLHLIYRIDRARWSQLPIDSGTNELDAQLWRGRELESSWDENSSTTIPSPEDGRDQPLASIFGWDDYFAQSSVSGPLD